MEDGGNISLAFRAVHTFLDCDTVKASCDTPLLVEGGAITEVALSLTAASVRE